MNRRQVLGIAVLASALSTFSSSVPARASGYPNPDPGRSATVSLAPGAYVIDAGVVTGAATTQTKEQALKPYGLIYALVKAQIPVLWVINPAKTSPGVNVNVGGVDQALGNVGTDFVYDCDAAGTTYAARSITTGAYVIEAGFVNQAKPVIDAFRGLNGGFPQAGTVSGVAQPSGQILGYDPSPLAGQVQGCTQALPTSIEVFNTITGWPRTVLDTDNGSIAQDFFDNAGILQGPLGDPANPPAYRFALPSQLTPCDDFYVMPHADPTYATHSNLRPFVEQGGYVWVGCHAVSVLEQIRVNDAANTPLYLNFLSTDGLLDYSDHSGGSAPYNFFRLAGDTREYYSPTYGAYQLEEVESGDPVAQFRGRTDGAHQNGSEQIFMPGYGTDPLTGAARTNWPANMADASRWREQTQVVLYDPTQANVYPLTTTVTPVDSLGPAAALVYGPAYGVATNGLVMYEGGHDINRGTADDAAAQRAFFNMQLLNGINRSPQVVVAQPAIGSTIAGGSTIPVSASATGGSGTYTYEWSATCTDANGAPAAGGSFADAAAATTTFTAPIAAGELNCNISLSVIDNCGRFSFDSNSIIVAASNPSMTLDKSALPVSVSAAGQTVNYSFLVSNTGNVTLSSIVVSDPLPGLSAISCPGASLAPTATMTCTASYTVTLGDMNAGSIANTASVAGRPPVGAPVGDTDSATVTATQSPSITVTKSALPATVTAAGQVISYSFVVLNSGNVTLTSVGVTDPLPGLSAVSCPGSSLAPSATMTCTASYTATLANMNAGSIANTVTVAGTPPTGPSVGDTDSATVTATQSPSITVSKSALPTSVTAAGQIVTYSFVVSNTGNVTLTSVGVTDPLPGLSAVSCPGSTLVPSASMTCTASYTVTQADMNAGSIANTATATGTPPNGPPVTDTGSATVPAPSTPTITIAKSVLPVTVSAAGQAVSYSFVVLNTGNVTLTSVGVTDPLPGLSAVSCPGSSLAPSASMTCTATYTVTQADMDAGSIANTATGAGTPPVGGPVDDSDSATVTATQSPSITVAKSALPTTVTSAGEVIAYSFLVTNTGNVTLISVAVSDPLPGLSAVGCPVSSLAPSVSTTCTASYTVTQADIDAGAIANTATVSGTPPSGPPVTDTGSTTVTAPSGPGITVVKTSTEPPYSAVGQILDFTVTATNTGNATLTNVTITDAFASLGTCSPVAPATLLPGATLTCAVGHAVTQVDLDHGSFDNVAAASGVTPQSATITDDSNLVTIPATRSPAITITKTTTTTNFNAVGQQVAFTITMLNTGNVTLTNVVVTDPNAVLGTCTPTLPATLAPGQSISCAAVHAVTQADMTAMSISNTAYITADAGASDITGTSNTIVVPGLPPPLIPRTGGEAQMILMWALGAIATGVAFLTINRRRGLYYLVLPPLESLRPR